MRPAILVQEICIQGQPRLPKWVSDGTEACPYRTSSEEKKSLYLFYFILFWYFWDRPCSPGNAGIGYVDKAGFELAEIFCFYLPTAVVKAFATTMLCGGFCGWFLLLCFWGSVSNHCVANSDLLELPASPWRETIGEHHTCGDLNIVGKQSTNWTIAPVQEVRIVCLSILKQS